MYPGERPVIFLDGSSLVYRAFYALPKLQTSHGRPTGATLGFLNMLLRLLDTYHPLMIVTAFDHPQKTFRHKMYKEYKAKRKPMPEEMKPQLEDIKKLLLTMGFLVLEVAGFEGDDLIGSGVAQLKEQYPLVIVTTDLDLLQLVDQKVILLQPIKGVARLKKIDLETLYAEWGILPTQVVDVLALAGDPSDNIQGVPGIGEKTALKLVREFESWEKILSLKDSLPPHLSRLLWEHRNRVEKNKELIQIKTGVSIDPMTFEAWDWQKVQWEEFLQKLEDLELKSLIERIKKRVANHFQSGNSLPCEETVVHHNKQRQLWAIQQNSDRTSPVSHEVKSNQERIQFIFFDFQKGKPKCEKKLLERQGVWCAPTLLFLVYPFLYLENPSLFSLEGEEQKMYKSWLPYLQESKKWILNQPDLVFFYRKVEIELLWRWFHDHERMEGFTLYPFLKNRETLHTDLPLFEGFYSFSLHFDHPKLQEFLEREFYGRKTLIESQLVSFRTIYGYRFLATKQISEEDCKRRLQDVICDELLRLSVFIFLREGKEKLIVRDRTLKVNWNDKDSDFKLEKLKIQLTSFLPPEWTMDFQREQNLGYSVLLLSQEGR